MNILKRKRLWISLAIVLLAILSYTSIIERAVSPFLADNLDARARAHLNETLKRSLYTYGVARALNAAISTLQGTSLSVSPAGVGVNLSIGEVLDPLNDLLEQFSWIMLLSATSIGTQLVLLQVGTRIGLTFILTLALLVILAGHWLRRGATLNLGYKLLIAAVVIRLCIPLVAVAGEGVYDIFLSDKYEHSMETLDLIHQDIKLDPDLDDSAETEKTNSWLGRLWDDLAPNIDVKKNLTDLKERATKAVDYILDLIVVFVLQTIIIPLIVLWGLIKTLGLAGSGAWPASLEKRLKETVASK